MTFPGKGDIQIEPPRGRGPGIVAAIEDRSYIFFIASALIVALAGGFLLAVVLPLSATGILPWEERVPRLVQAHGWAQLQGWAGLFVAGMGIRLLPRFAGRKPVSRRVTLPILALLVSSITVRTIVQPFVGGDAGAILLVGAAVAGGLGTLAVATVHAVTLARGRKPPDPWRDFARAGAAWWAVWAVFIVAAAIRGADNGRYTPVQLDDTLTWIVMLGAIGNFIWAVQSRAVPVFFNRKTPSRRQTAVPFALLNIGTLAIVASLLPLSASGSQRLMGAGLAMAGVGLAWTAPIAGAVRGQASRLRPRARSASRYVLAANLFAMVAGVLLIWAGLHSVFSGDFEAPGARDAARHAFGLGLITLLIVGMAQLVAPVFALERAEARSPGIEDHLGWWALLAGATMRVVAGLLYDTVSYDTRMHLAAIAGALAWIGLAMFAASVVRAVRKEPRMRALISSAADEAAATRRSPPTG